MFNFVELCRINVSKSESESMLKWLHFFSVSAFPMLLGFVFQSVYSNSCEDQNTPLLIQKHSHIYEALNMHNAWWRHQMETFSA